MMTSMISIKYDIIIAWNMTVWWHNFAYHEALNDIQAKSVKQNVSLSLRLFLLKCTSVSLSTCQMYEFGLYEIGYSSSDLDSKIAVFEKKKLPYIHTSVFRKTFKRSTQS